MKSPRTIAEYCKTLEVGIAVSPSELDRAYQRLVLIWHPDRFPAHRELQAEAEEKLKLINEAYSFLKEALQDQENKATAGSNKGPGESNNFSASPDIQSRNTDSRFGIVRVVILNCIILLTIVVVAKFTMIGKKNHSDIRPAYTVLGGNSDDRVAPNGITESVFNEKSSISDNVIIEIKSPTLVIFAPSQKELDETHKITMTDLDRFLQNATNVRDAIQKSNPGVVVQMTDADVILAGAERILRNQTCGYGYMFYVPSRPARVFQGIQPIDEMVFFANKLFHNQSVDATIEPTK